LVLFPALQKKKTNVPDEIKVAIDVHSKAQPISPNMYGMFMEQLGNADVGDLVDDGLWAELLDDRKFLFTG